MLQPDPSFESTDLSLLKHIWRISSADDRQLMLSLFSDDQASDESNPETKQLASLKRAWKRLSESERDAWRAFVTTETGSGQ